MKRTISILVLLFTIFSSCSKNSQEVEDINEASLNVSLHLQNRLNVLISKISPATVSVFPKGSTAGSTAIGSGFYIDAEGHVLTCHHVIRGGSEFLIQPARSGKLIRAKLIKEDPEFDLALLESVNEEGQTPFIPVPKMNVPREGTVYLSFGAAYGLPDSLSSGIVSFPQRSKVDPARPEKGFVQLSLPIYPGMSGGAVVDLQGNLIGVQRFTYNSGANFPIGPGFAIPAGHVSNFLESSVQLRENKIKVQRGIVEIPFVTPYLIEKLKLPHPLGMIVSYVQKDSIAEKAGIQRYDFITHVSGKKINTSSEFYREIASDSNAVTLEFFRNGKPMNANLGALPSQ
ncbi:PDZ domain-containing protein [Leptospira gomenensis]|uniref:PDZ domain-containing protein n=1 Tax=Leptospira gomenensis TaxID=2484974 RepID=A0A5F1Y9G9_9LEPT|nr:trypsin-like peptidase domain-containing protein [Leptospira gomenensis]TGK32750.1 PDZ domain-containing protein [Leptospira gomenensis]TGK36898.1 PDZ domain-containing protein [Leptospira gomenensis]TGK44369.1 PDZ domain-containing protein [Leptospira gomenensis]TGK58862.1 PDZ domain-containing protein [Leptospira gomenensis]